MLYQTRHVSDVGQRVGFIDGSGKVVIEPRFLQAQYFREGLAGVQTASGWGIIDPVGRMVVEPIYSDVGRTSEGLCAVMSKERKWGFVDTKGTLVIEPRLAHAYTLGAAPFFLEGLCAACDPASGRFGYLNRAGEWAIEPRFSRASAFAEGLALVEDDQERCSYVRPDGTAAFDGRWKAAWSFRNGLAAIAFKGRWGIIDSKGRELVAPTYRVPHQLMDFPRLDYLPEALGPLSFHGDRALFQDENKKWGYLDTDGRVSIPPTFERAGYFSEGFAPVAKKVKGKTRWGVIDPAGEVIGPFSIETMSPFGVFANGLAPAARTLDGWTKWGFVRPDASVAIEPQYTAVGRFYEGLAEAFVDGRLHYIDTTGRVIWSGL